MVDEQKQSKQEETTSGAKTPKAKVDLFPALADRRMQPINAIRQAPAPIRAGTQISLSTLLNVSAVEQQRRSLSTT
jgi:hypothetical protein